LQRNLTLVEFFDGPEKTFQLDWIDFWEAHEAKGFNKKSGVNITRISLSL
jgi:hypothetical protein